MGLTASPVAQPHVDKDKLLKEIKQLSINLDSTYSHYEREKEEKLKN